MRRNILLKLADYESDDILDIISKKRKEKIYQKFKLVVKRLKLELMGRKGGLKL